MTVVAATGGTEDTGGAFLFDCALSEARTVSSSVTCVSLASVGATLNAAHPNSFRSLFVGDEKPRDDQNDTFDDDFCPDFESKPKHK